MPKLTVEELRRWSAEELMGWKPEFSGYYHTKRKAWFWRHPETTEGMEQRGWRPDNPQSGQIWMVVEKMRELGWYFSAEPEPNLTFPGHPKGKIIYEIGFYHPERQKLELRGVRGYVMWESVEPEAILRAAHTAITGEADASH